MVLEMVKVIGVVWMTMCNICLEDKKTRRLDRLDLCGSCLADVHYKVEEYEKEAGKRKN